MLPDRVSNPGPLTYESGALPIALRGPAYHHMFGNKCCSCNENFLYNFRDGCADRQMDGDIKGKIIMLPSPSRLYPSVNNSTNPSM